MLLIFTINEMVCALFSTFGPAATDLVDITHPKGCHAVKRNQMIIQLSKPGVAVYNDILDISLLTCDVVNQLRRSLHTV